MPEVQNEWHSEVLPDGWERALDALVHRDALGGFYLAGGTGLALHLGHRRSADLDLFSRDAFDPTMLRGRLAETPGLRVRTIQRGTLHLEIQGVLVTFLHYPYPSLFAAVPFGPLLVADPRDITCMKLDAVSSRGSRRDFVDLYVAAALYGLRQVLTWFEQKYAGTPYNRLHVLKALTYFVDAEQEPMPHMLVPVAWDGVKQFFVREAPRLLDH